MRFELQVMASLVEHNLINRGLIPLGMRNSVPVAERILEADSAERVTAILDRTVKDFHDLDESDTIQDGEFLFKVAQTLKGK